MSVGEDSGSRGVGVSLASYWPGGAILLAAALAGLFAFRFGIEGLLAAWQQPEFSHGPLIPVISGFLFVRQLKRMPPNPADPMIRWPGAALMGVALVIGAMGTVIGIDDIAAYALILWIGGLVLACLGWCHGRRFWPPVLHLAFMLPLPDVFYHQTSIALQLVSSEIGVSIIRAVGIPVYLDGNIIDLDIYKLHVAEACSGLRYLFPMMSFTYIFAVLYQGSFWLKAVLLLAAIPIAVIMNAIRVGVIGVMVDFYGIEHAEGFMHVFEGWVVFGLCIAVMCGLAWAMKRLSGERRPLVDVLDIDTTGFAGEFSRMRWIPPSPAIIGPVLASACVGFALSLVPAGVGAATSAGLERDPFALFPRQLGEWSSLGQEVLDQPVARSLGADDYLSAAYVARGRPPVDVFLSWYRDDTDGGVHSPDVCIPASGWEISAIEAVEVSPGPGASSITLNRAVIQKGVSRQLVYFWFEQRGRRLTTEIAVKMHLLWDRVTAGRTDGGMVRLITPIVESDEAAADMRLMEVMSGLYPELPRFYGAPVPAIADQARS